MALINFDANTVAPQEAFQPLPAGWYPAQITGSEVKATKDGHGSYLALELTILGGQYNNRKVFDRLNLHNANETAVEIARKTLSAICHAVNVMQVQDSQELHGKPLEVKLNVKPERTENGNTYDPTNEVKGYRGIGGAKPVGAAASPAASPAGAADPAWLANGKATAQAKATKSQGASIAEKAAEAPKAQMVAPAEAAETAPPPPWAK